MDLLIHASAYSLGVKRSAIKLPWETNPADAIFGKKPKLIPPPVFDPLVYTEDETISLQNTLVETDISCPVADCTGEIASAVSGSMESDCYGQFGGFNGWTSDFEVLARGYNNSFS